MQILRVSLFVLAVGLCAWFVVGIRQAHEIDAATNVIAQGPSAGHARLAVAASQLSSAQFLDPDKEVEILRGRLAIADQESGRARRILEAVTRAEPLNLEAWLWLAGASLTDDREASIAIAHLDQLDPRDAGTLG